MLIYNHRKRGRGLKNLEEHKRLMVLDGLMVLEWFGYVLEEVKRHIYFEMNVTCQVVVRVHVFQRL